MDTRQDNHLIIYRATTLVGALAFVAAGLAGAHIDYEAIMAPLRHALVIALVAWAAATYLSSWARRYIGEGVLLIGVGMVGYFALTLYASSLGTREVIAAMTAVICGGLMYHRLHLALAWPVMCLVGFVSAAFLTDNPQFPPHMFALICVVLASFMSFAMYYTITSRHTVHRNAAIMEAIFNESSDALTLGDMEQGEIFTLNRVCQELFETDDWRVFIQQVREAFDDAGLPPLREMLSKQGSVNETLLFQSTTGKRFWGATAVSRLGHPHANLAVLRITDVTELHERTEALKLARDMAESAMEVRTRFLANMSHEIRTPMNGVIGMTSLLLDTPLDDEQASYVETIRSSGESLLTIINEILDFSKIEAGQIELEHQAFDIEQCVADALDIVSPIAAKKNLEVVLDLPPKHGGYVNGDVQRVRQVLVNLLSNAIKFTEEGEVSLLVRQLPDDLEGKRMQLRFEVTDTGIGIPPHKIDHLFEAFSQADASTTRRFGGTGLGLSISRSLVELMGGDITVTSHEGEGSTFAFHVNVERESSPRPTLGDFAGKHAAIIDDNATNRRVLAGLVAAWEITSVSYDHPQAFLDDYNAQFDLILTDMAMPDMDGLHLINELRARTDAQLPPTVLLTSLDRGDVDWNVFDAVLRKPIRPTDLHNAIGSAFGGVERQSNRRTQQSVRPFELAEQTVLLAEDNPVNQAVAKKMLQKLGIRVDVAATGREAIEMLTAKNYSVIFMDIQMPEIDGLEATRLIRLQEEELQPYIIAMTANAMAEDREACLESGMDDFVPKPIRIQDVQEALKRAVGAGAFSA